MTAQSHSHCTFTESLAIGGRCIVVVDAMLHGIVDKTIHGFLVDVVTVGTGFGQCRQTHTSVTEQRHLVAGDTVGPVGHLTRSLLG